MIEAVLAIWVGMLAALLRHVGRRREYATAVRRALELLRRERDLELSQVPTPTP